MCGILRTIYSFPIPCDGAGNSYTKTAIPYTNFERKRDIMIPFQRLSFENKAELDQYLMHSNRGCEYSFANLYMWGRQEAAVVDGSLVLFSQFGRSSVYPFPILTGDPKPVLDAIIADAARRGIRCRVTSLSEENHRLLEGLYPGRFQFYPDRDSYDYVYSIDALADLKGKKLQRKRNHLNRFRASHPDAQGVPLTEENLHLARRFVAEWYERRCAQDPESDFHLEQIALRRGFRHFRALELEGMLLMEGDAVLAFTLGSRLSPDTFDVHFEKAREDVDGAYTAINAFFARHLREKYPVLRYLDREDDLGIPGLRKAKESYCPEFLIEKSWARLMEDDDED